MNKANIKLINILQSRVRVSIVFFHFILSVIGPLHDGFILLLRPESFRFLLSRANQCLCYSDLAGITKFKCERKNEENSSRSSKMTLSCKWPIPGQFSGCSWCSRVFQGVQFPGLRTCLVIKPYSFLTFHVCFGLFCAQHTIAFKTSSDRHKPSLYVIQSLCAIRNNSSKNTRKSGLNKVSKQANIENG